MSDFEEKLNSVLSNPDAMSQIMNLAQSLNLGGGGGESPQGGQGGGNEPPPPPPPSGGGDGLGGLAGLGSLLGQIDPKWINRLLPLVGELTGGGSDERMQLLYALRPFLKPERQDKVERAAKTARLIHVGKKLLQSMGESDV
ncbi:MAG: hypothetical protein HFF70_04695 [Oscillospiraceae bacterium]|nr:hypothetical protein [Oscillospiraceae bacterium]